MPTENAGPLDISFDTTTTKTAIPMVADGHLVEVRLVKVEKQTSDKGPSIKFEYDLVNPAPNTDGGQILPGQMGSKFFDTIYLYDKNTPAGQIPQQSLVKIATRQDALLGTGDEGNRKGKPTRPAFNAESVAAMIGKTMVVKMRVKTGEYVGNEFGNVTFPGDIAA